MPFSLECSGTEISVGYPAEPEPLGSLIQVSDVCCFKLGRVPLAGMIVFFCLKVLHCERAAAVFVYRMRYFGLFSGLLVQVLMCMACGLLIITVGDA